MATGIIGSLGYSANLTYTAPTACKVSVLASSSAAGTGSTVNINGSSVFYVLSATTSGLSAQGFSLWVGGGQTVTFSTASASSAVISVYEG